MNANDSQNSGKAAHVDVVDQVNVGVYERENLSLDTYKELDANLQEDADGNAANQVSSTSQCLDQVSTHVKLAQRSMMTVSWTEPSASTMIWIIRQIF